MTAVAADDDGATSFFLHNITALEVVDDDEEDAETIKIAINVIMVAYSCIFLFGVIGNGWVIYNLLRTRPWSDGGVKPSQMSKTYILILALSDLLLLLTLPKTIIFFKTGDWMFGSLMCHVALAVEIFSKLFSILLLTVMSLERYFVVCTRWRHAVKHGPLYYLPLSTALLLCVLLPMSVQIYYTKHISLIDSYTGEQHRVCANAMPDFLFLPFVMYTFAMGFAAPLFVMSLCYVLLMRHVRAKFRQRVSKDALGKKGSVREPRYMSEMRKSIWRLAVYHFLCWGPFWVFTITTIRHSISQLSWVVYARLFANCLPYVNASGNWILYAVLNRDVRKYIYKRSHRPRVQSTPSPRHPFSSAAAIATDGYSVRLSQHSIGSQLQLQQPQPSDLPLIPRSALVTDHIVSR